LHYAPNDEGRLRLGITASRKVGKAVVRNRLKRRVRNVFRRSPLRWDLPAVDLVVHLEPAAAGAGFGPLAEELERLLGRVARGGGR
jgi:ribonuclease P protein component